MDEADEGAEPPGVETGAFEREAVDEGKEPAHHQVAQEANARGSVTTLSE